MLSRIAQKFFVVTVICALLHKPLFAQPQLDQFYEPQDFTLDAFIGVGATQMQTFTVGTSGYLSEIQFFGRRSSRISNPDGEVLVEIRRTSLGYPIMGQSGLLTSTSVPFTTLSEATSFIPFEFSNAPLVEAGHTFTIVIKSSGNIAVWGGDILGTYNGGLYFSAPASTGRPDPMGGADLGFRTFVQIVPEPAPALILATGLLLIILFRQGLPCSSRNELFVTSRLGAQGHDITRGFQLAKHTAHGTVSRRNN